MTSLSSKFGERSRHWGQTAGALGVSWTERELGLGVRAACTALQEHW